MRRALVWLVIAVFVAVVVAYAERRPLLVAVGGFLIARDAPRPADAIVVLSGSVPDRILEAVDLYAAHLAPQIILTREPPPPGLDALRARGGNLPEHHEENLAIAQQLGVPASAFSVLPTSVASTLGEAEALIRYAREQHIRSILLVTSKAHARRARLTFRTLASDTVQIAICPSPYDQFEAETWWHSRPLVRRVVIEYGKLLYFALIDRWRTHA